LKSNSTVVNKGDKRENVKLLLRYSLLFCILTLCVYGVLILSHKSFIQTGDGIKQGYFWTAELKRQIERLMAGGGISLWSWSRGIGLDVRTSFYLDPFNWIAALFPAGYIELGYTVAAVLKLYFGGLAFLAVTREEGLGAFAGIFGSLSYVFSGYFVAVSLVHSEILVNAYMFPLLVLGTERLYKGKSPLVFSLAVAYYLMANVYCAYMGAVAIVIYILIRYFAYHEFEIRDYLRTAGVFIAFGLVGICISAFQLFMDAADLMGASSESATDAAGLLFDTQYYLDFGRKLIGTGNTSNYQIAGLPVIVIMLAATALARRDRGRTNLVMTVISFAAMLLPAACSVLNGFGYPTLRWAFIFVFFACLTAADQIERLPSFDNKELIAASAAFIMAAAWALMPSDGELSQRAKVYICAQLAGGLALLIFLIAKHISKDNDKYRNMFTGPMLNGRTLICIILICTLAAGWTAAFRSSKGQFYRNNAINKMLESSTQRAGAMIDDDSFYRIDQVDNILYRHVVKNPPNESLWWQTRPVYLYNSRIPTGQLEFNRLTGDNYGYFRRVAVLSCDNRTGLDYLMGVKYFLGDDNANGRTGSDAYAGYGFEKSDVIDGVNVFKSKYDVSLGYTYDKYMTESDFEALGRLEREQALMQAAVVPDDQEITGAERIGPEDIETSVRQIGYNISETDGAVIGDGQIVAENDGASFVLDVDEVSDCQLVVSIDGLVRDPKASGQSRSFVLHAKNEFVDEMADNTITNQTIPFIRDYDLNMGYYDTYKGGITITLSHAGTYYFDSIRVNAMDVSLFDRYAEERSAGRYMISGFSDKAVDGTVTTEKPGIMFFSISDHDNWDVYIDGEKAELLEDVNIAFAGAELPAGSHEVTLRYNNRLIRIGGMISVIGLVLLALTEFIYRRRRIK